MPIRSPVPTPQRAPRAHPVRLTSCTLAYATAAMLLGCPSSHRAVDGPDGGLSPRDLPDDPAIPDSGPIDVFGPDGGRPRMDAAPFDAGMPRDRAVPDTRPDAAPDARPDAAPIACDEPAEVISTTSPPLRGTGRGVGRKRFLFGTRVDEGTRLSLMRGRDEGWVTVHERVVPASVGGITSIGDDLVAYASGNGGGLIDLTDDRITLRGELQTDSRPFHFARTADRLWLCQRPVWPATIGPTGLVEVELTDLDAPRPIGVVPGTERCASVAGAEDGSRVYVATGDDTLVVVDVRVVSPQGDPVSLVARVHSREASAFATVPSEGVAHVYWFPVAGEGEQVGPFEVQGRVIDLAVHEERIVVLASLPGDTASDPRRTVFIALAHDGARLIEIERVEWPSPLAPEDHNMQALSFDGRILYAQVPQGRPTEPASAVVALRVDDLAGPRGLYPLDESSLALSSFVRGEVGLVFARRDEVIIARPWCE